MECRETNLLQQLITKGQVHAEQNENLEKINKVLNVIGYEAIRYPHSTLLVLRDQSSNMSITAPWKEQMVKEAQEIFQKVANGSFVNKESPTVQLLLKNGWLREETSVVLCFTERALVQFSEFIENLNGDFQKCKLCEFLTNEGEYHIKCAEMLRKGE